MTEKYYKFDCNNTSLKRSNNSKGDKVYQLNYSLFNIGFLTSMPNPDNEYNSDTETAVKKIQKILGEDDDGWFGPKTCKAWNTYITNRIAQENKPVAISTYTFICSEVSLKYYPEDPVASDDAYALNYQMKNLGYNISQDLLQFYDKNTYEAVITFQKSHGLTPDGWFAEQTCKKWRSYYLAQTKADTQLLKKSNATKLDCSANKMQEGSESYSVMILQQEMKDCGLYDGLVNGLYGPKTKASVISFQNKYDKLLNDGIFGPYTCSYWKDYYSSQMGGKKDSKKSKSKKKKGKSRKDKLKQKMEHGSEVSKIINEGYDVAPNISIGFIEMIANTIDMPSNAKGVNIANAELMDNTNKPYIAHPVNTEYDVTVPMPNWIFKEVKQDLYNLCNSKQPVVSTSSKIEQGDYYISITLSDSKGYWLLVKFHLTGR